MLNTILRTANTLLTEVDIVTTVTFIARACNDLAAFVTRVALLERTSASDDPVLEVRASCRDVTLGAEVCVVAVEAFIPYACDILVADVAYEAVVARRNCYSSFVVREYRAKDQNTPTRQNLCKRLSFV